MSYKDDSKRLKAITDQKVRCSCGHTQLIARDKAICSWCGHYIYKNKKTKFLEEIKKRMIKYD